MINNRRGGRGALLGPVGEGRMGWGGACDMHLTTNRGRRKPFWKAGQGDDQRGAGGVHVLCVCQQQSDAE